jgi:hypothetical protein
VLAVLVADRERECRVRAHGAASCRARRGRGGRDARAASDE